MGVVDEKKNRRIAVSSTIGLHAALLVFFFFAIGWRAPDPPFGSTEGFVINLGFDDVGSGDVQPEPPLGTEEAQTNPQTDPAETANEKTQPEEKTTEPEPQSEEQITAKDETAVAIKDTKETKKKEDAPVKPTETKEKTEQQAKEPEKPIAVYDPNKKKGTADGKAGATGSEGDDINKTGDKGQPDGQPGPGMYKGKAGGGGGNGSLNIAGWLWDEVPQVKAPSTETSGRVVFQIKVNAEGEIIDIKTLERSLSLEMENLCRREIEKLTFSKTGTNVPEVTTGKITFVVLSN